MIIALASCLLKYLKQIKKLFIATSLSVLFVSPLCAENSIFIDLPKTGLQAHELAVIYLIGDLKSELIASKYQRLRNIPAANVIGIKFKGQNRKVSPGEFAVQKRVVDGQLSERIQALALAWDQPYKVGCMSMSAAFAFGYDVSFCASGCEKTKRSAYYHSGSLSPYTDFNFRPTMMLAAATVDDAESLILRGVNSDNTQPNGDVYLLTTSDNNRSVRNIFYNAIKDTFGGQHAVNILSSEGIKDRSNILFYFTGAVSVPYLDSLSFLPGAMADHLTSHGGRLTDSTQMSAMRWLEAGATGSYGTAIEPCNFLEKFPNPLIAMWHYKKGSSLIESYWKSVQMPGQGNFIGEPLASPFTGYRLVRWKNTIRIFAPSLREGRYTISVGQSEGGLLPMPSYLRNLNTISNQNINKQKNYLELKPPYYPYYRVERL
tara:strand:+ start:2195 stop:3490 length:1296 start_codon:yes stop_codon:yes gene_type:complete